MSMHKNKFYIMVIIFLCTLFSCADTQDILLNVERVELPNGLKILLVNRPGAQVFSANIRIRVGNIEEPQGFSGLAHFFEHMAFKGTSTIGVKDFEKEKEILAQIHALGTEITTQKKQGSPKDVIRILEQQLDQLQIQQQGLIEKNEFVRIYQKNGGSNVNATTSNDYTDYFVSLPSCKMELWAYLESERLLHPVLREFYKERDVVAEERRMRYDNSPDGRIFETFMATAFDHSPYGINVIGLPDEIQNYTYESAKNFRETYYIPSRIVIGLVGNFDVKEAKRVIKKYFGALPFKENSEVKIQNEVLDSTYPRNKIIYGKDEPRFYMGYHRPAHPHPDDEVFDVIQTVLCEGRTSRLFKTIVDEKKMASSIGCYASLPGSRLDGLFSFYANPLSPYTNEDVSNEILNELKKLKEAPLGTKELEKIKNRLDADMVWSLKSNKGLSSMLTFYESLSGDWKYLYRLKERVHAITEKDIQEVAKKYFVPERLVKVYLEKE